MFIIGTISAKLRIFPFIHFVCRVLYISELNWTLLLSAWLLSVLCFLNSWKKTPIHPFKGTLSSILVWLTSVNGTGNYTANAKKTLLKCSIRKFKWREEEYYFCRNFKNILSTKSRSSEYYLVCYFHAISQPFSLRTIWLFATCIFLVCLPLNQLIEQLRGMALVYILGDDIKKLLNNKLIDVRIHGKCYSLLCLLC